MKLNVPYLCWRNGRPRWEPGPKLRREGWHGRDLKDDAGRWLSKGAAAEAAARLNAEVAEKRTAAQFEGAPRPRPEKSHPFSARNLALRWRKSPRYLALSDNTRDAYERHIDIFLGTDFGDAPVRSIEKAALYGWWETLVESRGLTMANRILAAVSSMFAYGELIGWLAANSNPALRMKRLQAKPRTVFWLPAELAALVVAADELAMPEVADAVIIALHSGQRLGDVLAMPPRIFEPDRLRLTQMKRGALIDAPMTTHLKARVTAIRARWQAAGVVGRATIVARSDGRAFVDGRGRVDCRAFAKLFRVVRTAAAARFDDVETQKALLAKTFQDLRDTSVTRLACAKCDAIRISAISGHSVKTVHSIIKHYLVLQPEMADEAIAKLQAWLDREGIAV